MSFDVTIASLIGLDNIIFLEKLWLLTMVKNENWIAMTHEKWLDELPFFSKVALRRVIRDLKMNGMLEVANRNERQYARTLSYRFNDKKFKEITSKIEK